MGLLLLTVIISGLALHAWLFIEIQLKKLAFVKIDKIVNPMKHTFNKSKHLHLQYVVFLHQILMNVFNIANISSIIIYTETIDISIKPCFSSHYLFMPFEMIPKHNGVGTIFESFASNLQISVPLTNKSSTFFLQLKYVLILVLVLFQELIPRICLDYRMTKNWKLLKRPSKTNERNKSLTLKLCHTEKNYMGSILQVYFKWTS